MGPPAGAESYFDPSELPLRRELEASHWWHLHRREVVRREVERALPRGRAARLVDAGCGIGTVAIHLAAHGHAVDAIDVHDEALAIARDRAREALGDRAGERLRFFRADVTEGLPVDAADGVLLLDVIEHLPDDVRALRHARAALREAPGAFVLVTVPAFPILWSPWDELERHRRRYTRASLARALRAAGLAPERITCLFAPIFPAALAVQAARRGHGLVRAALGLPQPPPPRTILDALEAKHAPWLDRAVLAALAPERRVLPLVELPLGTSLLALARPEAA